MMKQLIYNVKQIFILFLVISIGGCDDNDVIIPEVDAGYTYTINQETNTVTFINTSVNADTYSWSFGDDSTSNLINPVKTYSVGSYTVVLTAANVAGASDTFEDTFVFLDQKIPLIMLLGDSTIDLIIGDTFSDPGATALDEVDGDLSANIIVGGDTVDTNTEGTYVITYNVSDTAGNAAAEATRIVNVTAPPTGPTDVAPTPTHDAANVISLFSDAYNSITVSEWSTGWDDADIADDVVDGNNVKKVTFGSGAGGFLGVDFSANAFDATSMTHFHMDYWISDDITAGQVLNPKWSNHTGGAGETNAFEYTNPVSESGQWVSLDIPIADFGGDTTRDNLAQFILATGATLTEVYFDNIYLYSEGGGAGSTADYVYETATTAVAIASTISDWGSGTGIDSNFGGDATYNPSISLTSGTNWGDVSALAFTAIEAGKILDYTTLEFKIKTTDYTTIRVKVPGASIEEPAFTIADGVTLADGWVQMSIPLTEFGTIPDTINEFAILEFGAGNILITDVGFSGMGTGTSGGGGGGTTEEVTVAAPTPPARNAADVISLFSDAYTDIGIDTWSADWDDSSIEDVMVDGNATKKITFTNFIGVDFQSSRFDATAMTHFHIDFWTSNADLVGKVFNSKFSNWSGGAGETSAIELNINEGTTPPLATGAWVSVDLPLGAGAREDLVQFLITSNLGVVYVDNIYLYK